MSDSWKPLCLVAHCDVGDIKWPLPVVELDNSCVLYRNGEVENLSDIYPQLAIAISRSPEGCALLDRLDSLLDPDGCSLENIRIDLSSDDNVSDALVVGLADGLARSQKRVVRQVQEVTELRKLTERSLQHFERLEAFVWQTARCDRSAVLSLLPRADGRILPLKTPIQQRLPTDSVGLSDIAIWLPEGGIGLLDVTLSLMESAETVADWRVIDPVTGWLRFGLPRALTIDSQTALLNLRWSGAEALQVALSHDHPDPRLQCWGTAMLALRLWKFIPGTHAPLTPEAIVPVDQKVPGRWLIGLSAFREAASRASDPAHVYVIEGRGSLVLRPEPEYVVGVLLSGLARAGMMRIQSMLTVEGGPAGVAFAITPLGEMPDEANWQLVSAVEEDQLHLFLSEPLDRTQDLWVLAQATGGEPAQIIFERIEVFASATGQDD